jgi:hypothetical protein
MVSFSASSEAPYTIPPGARGDEIFADVVHDGPKKIEMYPNRWSKGKYWTTCPKRHPTSFEPNTEDVKTDSPPSRSG